ncbi:hypothetical protein MAC_02208 [Metarhizium acridum CQMa 102]|uniref:Peptidase S1 domain-containing protein n=1 Tax=Metarhizium acridum (strain CQMa 102) TaxID=655827 RepID=E9DX60_METAQ|nr:uncharacterized protein MAC_02208 [Metarhizium acridum CQMa 102]EFY91618.1 hypothetical protein MAC_02208 [Metarhizium acridum CQMa 102]
MLRKASIPIFTREDCVKLDPESGGRDSVLVVCAGGAGQNVCKYDSGGSLVDQETGQVIGLASLIIPQAGYQLGDMMLCNEAPTLFTRVGSHVRFILENLGASKQPSKQREQSEADKQLQTHCGRSGNEKTCMRAAFRCTGQVEKDAPIRQFLEFVDRMQVCADQDNDTDKCIAKAKECKEKDKLPLGDVAKLAQCAKKDL